MTETGRLAAVLQCPRRLHETPVQHGANVREILLVSPLRLRERLGVRVEVKKREASELGHERSAFLISAGTNLKSSGEGQLDVYMLSRFPPRSRCVPARSPRARRPPSGAECARVQRVGACRGRVVSAARSKLTRRRMNALYRPCADAASMRASRSYKRRSAFGNGSCPS